MLSVIRSVWSPAWIAVYVGIADLIALAIVGLAVVGKVHYRALEEYEKLSEARGERIAVLEETHKRDMATAEERHTKSIRDAEALQLSIEALQGQVAMLQRNEADAARRNLELQRQLEASKVEVVELRARTLVVENVQIKQESVKGQS